LQAVDGPTGLTQHDMQKVKFFQLFDLCDFTLQTALYNVKDPHSQAMKFEKAMFSHAQQNWT